MSANVPSNPPQKPPLQWQGQIIGANEQDTGRRILQRTAKIGDKTYNVTIKYNPEAMRQKHGLGEASQIEQTMQKIFDCLETKDIENLTQVQRIGLSMSGPEQTAVHFKHDYKLLRDLREERHAGLRESIGKINDCFMREIGAIQHPVIEVKEEEKEEPPEHPLQTNRRPRFRLQKGQAPPGESPLDKPDKLPPAPKPGTGTKENPVRPASNGSNELPEF